MYIILAVACSS